VQNIGANGVEVKDVIKEVHVIEITTVKPHVFSNKECKFGYRDSIFRNELKNRVIITSVVFFFFLNESYNLSYKILQDELQNHTNLTLALVKKTILSIRRSKLPDIEEIGSAGSFFKNPVIQKDRFEKLQAQYPQLISFKADANLVKLSAAQLIDISGWKGFREGDIGVYLYQSLVLVNYGNATGEEIMNLSIKIQESVFEKFEVRFECEAQII
jgi:UDP-N-acetylmuramate dehydrogenase